MASLSLQQSQRQLHARLAQAAITLAQREAEKAVKHRLIKLQYVAKREIVTLAKDYLAEHPELIAEAKPIVEQWRSEGFFGKRAARTGHILAQSMISSAKQGEVSQ